MLWQERERAYNDQAMRNFLRGISGQQMPNLGGVESPVQHLLGQISQGAGGMQLSPSATAMLGNDLWRYNQQQRSAAQMLPGDEGERARQAIEEWYRRRGR